MVPRQNPALRDRLMEDCFDVRVIERYFPEFERELPRYLAGG
jgi:hypothetical protein